MAGSRSGAWRSTRRERARLQRADAGKRLRFRATNTTPFQIAAKTSRPSVEMGNRTIGYWADAQTSPWPDRVHHRAAIAVVGCEPIAYDAGKAFAALLRDRHS